MKTIRVDGITSIGAACCNVGSKKGCPLDVWRLSVASGDEAEGGMKTIGVDGTTQELLAPMLAP